MLQRPDCQEQWLCVGGERGQQPVGTGLLPVALTPLVVFQAIKSFKEAGSPCLGHSGWGVDEARLHLRKPRIGASEKLQNLNGLARMGTRN